MACPVFKKGNVANNLRPQVAKLMKLGVNKISFKNIPPF